LRALAVTAATRWHALLEVPAVSEFVPGYEATGWIGIGAPKGTPTAIIDRLNREINAGLADPKIKARFEQLVAIPLPMSTADFSTFVVGYTDKWSSVIRRANIKPE